MEADMQCPKCSRDIRPTWNVCPFCELPLTGSGQDSKPLRKKEAAKKTVPQMKCPICNGTGMATCWMCIGGLPRYYGIDTICRYCSGTARKKCGRCSGRGTVIGDDCVVVCRHCGGRGKRTCPSCSGTGLGLVPPDSKIGTCVSCHGSGMEPCLTCLGAGKEPWGTHHIRLGECYACEGKGKGDCSLCGGSGECYVSSKGRFIACPDCRGASEATCLICHGTGKWTESALVSKHEPLTKAR